MKSTNTTGKHLPSGMVSLKMFQINHSKALIIAYLNLRGGLKKYAFNVSDISKKTNIGKTVVRKKMKELEAEGVLNRSGLSFYKLNRQKLEELYYCGEVSEFDKGLSESDNKASENDTHVSETDNDASESDSIHSSNLDSIKLQTNKLDSSSLDSSEKQKTKLPECVVKFLEKSPKEQLALLDNIEANKTMAKDLREGKEVRWTGNFVDQFANM